MASGVGSYSGFSPSINPEGTTTARDLALAVIELVRQMELVKEQLAALNVTVQDHETRIAALEVFHP